MTMIVILPGGYHPFHAGHMSLYNAATRAFPGAEIYVASSGDTKTRPFPFTVKRNLATLSGVDPSRFIQVKSPFSPSEITNNFDPNKDIVVFVRSEKDKNESPLPGQPRKDGTPSYYQAYSANANMPFGKHAYMAYLPTVEFANGFQSASEIRETWPKLSAEQKMKMIVSLYPRIQNNSKLINNVVNTFDQVLDTSLKESTMNDIQSLVSKIKPLLSEATIEQKEKFVGLLENAKSRLNANLPATSSIDDLLGDPEERAALMYAKQHYPSAPDTQSAFVKFVLHSLRHSKEDDERQDSELETLANKVDSLQDKLKNVNEVTSKTLDEDYLPEY